MDELKDKILEIFPNSYVSVRNMKGLSDDYWTVHFTIGMPNEWSNGIPQNDPCIQTIFIWKDLMVESSSRHFTIASDNPMFAFGSCSNGWRNFKAKDYDHACNRIVAYFKQLKQRLIEAKPKWSDAELLTTKV